jgi:inorganic pyrophosphatase
MEGEKISKSLELAKAFLGKSITITIGRPMGTRHPKYGFEYKANYGFVDGIKAPDGDDLDAYYLGVNEVLQTGNGICIAIAHRRDNDDDKLIVVPEGADMSDEEIMAAIHFQEQWFDTKIVRSTN